jgi:hypothetical protein
MKLAGRQFGHNKSLVAASGSTKTIFPSKIYNYTVSGTIRGKGGTLGALFPKAVPLSEFLALIDTNNDDNTAALLSGSFDNPNGGLGVTLASNTVKGSKNYKGIGKVSVQLKFAALVDANGQVSLEITGVKATVKAKPKSKAVPLTGVLVFGKGSKIVVSTAPVVEFKAVGQPIVNETAGTVEIIVTRQGNQKKAATVQFATADGTAVAGADYEVSTGTVTFVADNPATPENENEQLISIPLISSPDRKGFRNFTVILSTPSTGAVLGEKTTTTVSIAADA